MFLDTFLKGLQCRNFWERRNIRFSQSRNSEPGPLDNPGCSHLCLDILPGPVPFCTGIPENNHGNRIRSKSWRSRTVEQSLLTKSWLLQPQVESNSAGIAPRVQFGVGGSGIGGLPPSQPTLKPPKPEIGINVCEPEVPDLLWHSPTWTTVVVVTARPIVVWYINLNCLRTLTIQCLTSARVSAEAIECLK